MKMLGKFKKTVGKMEGVTTISTPPSYWTTSGNYVLNRILTGSLSRAVGQGRVMGLVGPSGCLPGDEEVTVYVMKTISCVTPVLEEK